MFEVLRRLTANYTEEEYKEWLAEPIAEPVATKRIPTIRGDERNKHVATALAEVALDTGYEPEFLYEVFDEQVNDRIELGEDIITARREAFDHVATVSYEQDW